MPEEAAKFEGIVQRVIYTNPDNGYTVLELARDDDVFPAVGILPNINPGEHLSVTGRWTFHKDYGKQFTIDSVEVTLPESVTQIKKYLASGAIPGVGPVLAERITDAFGEESLSVIETDYFRLAEVKGISVSKAEEISRAYNEQFGLRTAMLFLQQYALTPAECIRIYKKYGLLTREVIQNDPYILSTRMHLAFDRVDAIAFQMGFEASSQKRIMAGILYVMTHNCSNGHTFIPRRKVTPVAMKLLGCEEDVITDATELLIESEDLYSEEIEEVECLFLPDCYRAESYIAGRLCVLNRSMPSNETDYERLIRTLEKQFDITYAPEQREAVSNALQRGLLILTGGPGTGKTTVIRAILEGYRAMGLDVCLAAPTGRAAKRMTELTGQEAKTVHRLLEASVDENGLNRFSRNEKSQLDYSAIILDEASMVDIFMMESLLRALKLNCRIVLVGDADQLPSVGPGNLLRDLVESGLLPCVSLRHIFRQAEQSLMITNSHRVINGELPILDDTTSDFFFIGSPSDTRTAQVVCDLVSRRLPQAYKFDSLWDIQVICPSKKGAAGTVSLNTALQNVLNPDDGKKMSVTLRGTTFRVGDKVMQTRNNYDLIWSGPSGQGSGLYNGDIGVIESIDTGASTLRLRVEDKKYEYPFTLSDDLDLAYAITVHKSQGSEFEAVVFPVGSVPEKLVYRNLFYTAITRAKKMIVLVGSKETVAAMVKSVNKNARFTALGEFLFREEN